MPKDVLTQLNVASTFRTSGRIAPTFTSGQQINDANPTGIGNSYILVVGTEYGGQRLTGVIAPNVSGVRLIIQNSSGVWPLLIPRQHAGSTANNRFELPMPVLAIPPLGSAEFIYRLTPNRWELLNYTAFDQVANPMMFDDFFGLSTETGEAGEHGWTFTNGSFAALNDPSVLANGVIRRTSGVTAAQVASMNPGSTTLGGRMMQNIFDCTWRIALVATNADFAVRFGWTSDAGAAAPVNGVYFERLAADTSFFGVSRNTSAENRTAALLAQDTNFHTFRVARANGSNLIWVVDEQTTQTVQTPANIPDNTDVMVPFLHIVPTTTTARSVDIDYCMYRDQAAMR